MEHRERESGPGRLRVLLAVGVTGLLVSSAMGAVDTLWLRKFWGVDSAAPFIFNRVADMCTDSKGYVYVCGSGEHPAPTSHANMLLAKYNQWGETLWMRSIDGNTYSPDDIAHAIAVDSVGNVYVAGTTRNVITAILQDGYDITWGKFDSSGNMISVNKLRVGYPEDDCAYDIVIGKRGDVYICGAVGIDTTTYFGSAFFVMRTRTDSLYPMWVRGYVLDSAAFRSKERRQQSRDRHPDFIYWDDWQDWDNCAAAMEVGPDSCLVVVGYGLHRTREYEAWTMKFRDSTRLWEDQEYYRGADRDDALFDVAVARNGYIYATGIGTGWTDDYDAYTLRYAPTGGSPAEEVIPGSNQYDDYGCAICLDDASPLQNVYVCGYEDVVGSGYQAFTQKYTAGLSPRWGSAGALYGRGGASNEHAFDVAYHRGRVYVTGIAGQDMFVAAYDTLNTQPHDTLWSYKWNGPFNEQDMGAAVCVVDTDHVYAGGQYDRPSMAGYVNDLFLMRLGTPRPDLRAELVVAPTETTAYGATVTPRVRFVNDGNMRAVFWTKLWIGTGYRDSIGHGTWLYPGDSVTLSFADWTALPEGWAAVRCSLAYPGDIDPSDNVLLDSTFVVRRDVGCLRIVAPAGTVDSGGTLQPQAWLRNWGNAAQTFDAVMRVGPSYCDTVTVAVGAGDSALQAFAGWTPGQRGTWPVKCTTVLATDVNPGNNWREGTVTVRVVDMAMLGIMAPPARVDSGRPVTPRVRIGNYGSEPTTTWIFCRLDDGTDVVVYSESAQATVDPGREETLTFPESETLVRVGVWGAAAEVAAAGDRHPENDSARGSFRVYPPGLVWPRGWVEVEPIPLTPSSKAVKDGGWLAIDPAQDVIYCGKGYKTPDFYSRPVLGTVWTQLTSIPLGLEAKPPYKGAQGICDGEGSVYATKGNGTVGFWRYDIGAQTWTQLPNVPLGPSGKKVKGGTDMAYVVENDTGYVYLLKGYKQDFFRFNTVSGVWDTNLSLAPAGARAKYDKGSFLVHDEAGKLYAHKAKYHELWAFDIVTHTWASTALPGMPLVGMMGKSKKSKDGGAGAWFDGSVYALKGGNTQEFWQFRVDSAAWRELDTMPAYGSTGKKKRVKAGGDIVYSSLAFWALKGNKTLEFWRYGLSLDVEGTARPERSGIAAGPRGMPARFGYALRPSPVAGRDCALEYSVPQPTAVRCRLFDASGRLVRTMPGGTLSGSGLLRLDLGGLSAGVYLFRLEAEAEGAGFVQKLVLR